MATLKQKQIQIQKPQIASDMDFQDAMIEERNREIVQIRKDMQDVNKLFQDTAELINQQGEQIDDIKNNITKAKDDVEYGYEEIKEAEKQQDKSNSLTLWIAGGITTIVTISAGIAGAIFLL